MTGMQKQVAEFVAQHNLEAPLPYRLLDLTSELGEVAKELLAATDYGKRPLPAGSVTPNWEAELGDVLFSLICVANATAVDLESALAATLEKYRQRLAARGDPGSGKQAHP